MSAVLSRAIQIGVFIGFLVFILAILPTAQPLPVPIETSFTLVIGYLYSLDWILPVDALLTVFGIRIAVEDVLFAWKIIKYLISIVKAMLGDA